MKKGRRGARFLRAFVLLASATSAVACNDDETNHDAAEHCGCGDIGPPGGYGPHDAGPQTMTYSGKVVEGVPGKLLAESPLADVEVCPVDAEGERLPERPCSTTDSDGAYSLELPFSQHAIVRYARDGYRPQIAPVDVYMVDVESMAPVRLAPFADDAGGLTNFGWNPGTAIEPETGMAVVFAVVSAPSLDTGNAGAGADFARDVSFTLSPDAGVEPEYMDREEVYVPNATATSGAYAWFVNVPSGTYTITAHSRSMSCGGLSGNGLGWPEPGGSVTIPIVADMTTQSAGFYCAP